MAPDGVDYIFTPFSAGNVEKFAELLRPGGEITAIDEPEGMDLLPLKAKSLTWHWELMFTRPLYAPEDTAQAEQLVTELQRDGRWDGELDVRRKNLYREGSINSSGSVMPNQPCSAATSTSS